jgi:hypothetical protein
VQAGALGRLLGLLRLLWGVMGELLGLLLRVGRGLAAEGRCCWGQPPGGPVSAIDRRAHVRQPRCADAHAHAPPAAARAQVAASHLRSHCAYCSAALGNTVQPRALRKRVTVLRSLAGFHGFEMVGEMADWALQHMGAS